MFFIKYIIAIVKLSLQYVKHNNVENISLNKSRYNARAHTTHTHANLINQIYSVLHEFMKVFQIENFECYMHINCFLIARCTDTYPHLASILITHCYYHTGSTITIHSGSEIA